MSNTGYKHKLLLLTTLLGIYHDGGEQLLYVDIWRCGVVDGVGSLRAARAAAQVPHEVGQDGRQLGAFVLGHGGALLRCGVHGLDVAVVQHGGVLQGDTRLTAQQGSITQCAQ